MKKHRGMKPQDIFSTAWQITWDNKILLVFGFFAALTLGDNSSSFMQGGSWFFQNIGSFFSSNVLVTFLMLVSALIFWVLGVLARISIVREVAALDVRKPKPVPPIKESLSSSLKYLVRVLLMQLLVLSPILVFSLMTYIFTKPLSNGFPNSVNQSNFAVFFTGIFLGAGIGILITILFTTIDAFAFRGIVLEELDVKNSIKNAIQIIRANLKFIFQLGVICAIVGGIFSFILVAAISPLLLVMMKTLTQTVSQCAAYQGNAQAMANCMQQLGTNPTIVAVNVIVGILGGLVLSIWATLRSASFTLAYKKFTESKKPA
jgi:hypothetical protein